MNMVLTDISQHERDSSIFILFTFENVQFALALFNPPYIDGQGYKITSVSHWDMLEMDNCPFCKETSHLTRCKILEERIPELFQQIVSVNHLRLFWLYHDVYWQDQIVSLCEAKMNDL